jgi:hypothetical protein
MRKVDVSHHIGFELPEDAIEKLKSFESENGCKETSVKEIANVFKEFKNLNYKIIITFYPEKDIGESPYTIVFIVGGGKNEPK